MRKLKHLPPDQWPAADMEAFASAFAPGDIFDETAGPGAHLAEGTRRMIPDRLSALARLSEGLLPRRSFAGSGRPH